MKKTTVQIYDDIWHAEYNQLVIAQHTASVGIDGRWYEVDLTEEHYTELTEFFARYAKVGVPTRYPSLPPKRYTPPTEARKEFLRSLHRWADSEGRTYKSPAGNYSHAKKLIQDFWDSEDGLSFRESYPDYKPPELKAGR